MLSNRSRWPAHSFGILALHRILANSLVERQMDGVIRKDAIAIQRAMAMNPQQG
jgi:hypothetical protein